jgi:hypothetical protein
MVRTFLQVSQDQGDSLLAHRYYALVRRMRYDPGNQRLCCCLAFPLLG